MKPVNPARSASSPSSLRRTSAAWLAAFLAPMVFVPALWAAPQDATAQDAAGSQEAAGPKDAAGPQAAAASEAAEDTQAAAAQPTRQWLVDADGKRYFIDKIRKGRFTRLEDDVVKPWRMPALRIEREDDDYFYFRVFEPQSVKTWSPSEEVTDEDLRRYELAEQPQVDTLRFVSFDDGLPARGQWRNGFELADMNGDGHTDLVHGPARKSLGEPVIFLGDDAGHWKPWREADYPVESYDYGDVAVADFNGDSIQDLALGMHLTGALVLVQDGKGSFREWSDGIALRRERGDKIEFSGKELLARDWNGDGRPDLLLLSEGPGALPRDGAELPASPSGVRLYVNGGDGTWQAVDSPPGDRSFGDDLLVLDLDGDGIHDMVTASRTTGYHDLVKLGAADGSWRAVSLDGLPGRLLVWSLASGDLDGDGRADLVVGYRDNRWGIQREAVDVLLNRSRPGHLSWERRLLAVRQGSDRYGAVGVGDVDGDGRADVVALNGLGGTEVYLGNGDGTFRREAAPELEPDRGHSYCDGYEVQLRDLDGDGRDEILAGFAGEPGGEAYLIGVLETRCSARGSLRAWRSEPAPPPAAETPPGAPPSGR